MRSELLPLAPPDTGTRAGGFGSGWEIKTSARVFLLSHNTRLLMIYLERKHEGTHTATRQRGIE